MSKKRPSCDDNPVTGGVSKKAKKSSFIPLPDELAKTGALVNVRNTDDDECFKWSVLAALHPDVQEPEEVYSYLDFKEGRMFDELTFPMNKKDIPQFARLNSMGVNLFGYDADSKTIFPDLVNNENQEKVVDLLYTANDGTAHYSWIKNFSALMGDTRKHYCRCCLEEFDQKKRQQSHTRLCRLFEPQKVEFPSGDKAKLSDKYPNVILHAPYVIYADFECIQLKAQGRSEDDNESRMVKLTDHQPSGYAYKVVGPEGEVPRPVKVYRGENVVDRFMQDMDQEKNWIENQLSKRKYKTSNLSPQKIQNCFICKVSFSQSNRNRYDYMSPTCENFEQICWKCNKNYNEQVIVVFHNLANYDGHFIIAHKKTAEKCTFCIAPSIDKYCSFQIGSLKFIDSLSFLKDSLANLVLNLAAAATSMEDNFKLTFGLDEVKGDIDKLCLLLRKQVYPYDYMDSFSKFEETSLPDKNHFKNILKEEDISDEDYQHAKKVWREFKIKNLGEYHDLYVKSDVVLLADVFENFRTKCKDQYSLDPAYCYSLAGLSWEAALKQTKPDLDLLTDREMYLMIESGIRGGVAMMSQRFAKANNPLLTDYDSIKPKTYIIYLDANNLYGWAMSQYLPTGEFKWLTPEEIEDFKIDDVQIDSETGYILEVDLKYPQELHHDHNDYPLAPEKIVISNDMLSPFAKPLFSKFEKKDYSETKLAPNLRDKEKYVVHYRALQLYLKLGLKLTKIHRVVSFQQSPWLKPYIDSNTERRKSAKNNSDSDMFKQMNNCFYGKTFQNIRKYRDVKFLTNETEVKKHASQLNCEETKSISEGLTAVLMKKRKITLNKPIYIGFSVLEISKTLIYDFHYNFIRQKYKDKARLLFTDTDSLCYEIETEDIYDDMLQDLDRFDTSDYPANDPLHSDVNKKVVGKIKDETKGVPIEEFVGLRPKMYSLKYGGNGKKCAVGVDKNYRERKLSHDDYKKCLDNREETEIEQVKITNIGHQVHTVRERRAGLSPYDDKRYVLDDGIHTLAYGHNDIPVAQRL